MRASALIRGGREKVADSLKVEKSEVRRKPHGPAAAKREYVSLTCGSRREGLHKKCEQTNNKQRTGLVASRRMTRESSGEQAGRGITQTLGDNPETGAWDLPRGKQGR